MARASLYFVGAATTIITFGELRILTDPNFLHQGERAYLGYGLTSRRLTEPALSVEELPDIDVVLLSHLHGDHWDRRASRGLDRDLPIVTTPSAAGKLGARGFRATHGLRTWDSWELAKGDTVLTVTAMPGRHAPGLLRHVLPSVMGSMLEFRTRGEPVQLRLYISGDTLLVEELSDIPQRFSDIDTAVLHLGGTVLPGGLMVTMDARQGADLMQLLDPGTVVPVHFDDYGLFKSPLSDFRAEVERRGVADRVQFVDRGDTVDLVHRER